MLCLPMAAASFIPALRLTLPFLISLPYRETSLADYLAIDKLSARSFSKVVHGHIPSKADRNKKALEHCTDQHIPLAQQ